MAFVAGIPREKALYVQAWSKTFSQTEAVRIRLDSLGDGVPD